jgi:hypothetical protein
MLDVGADQVADLVSYQVGFAPHLLGDFRQSQPCLPSGEDHQVSGVFVHFHTRSIGAGRADSQGAIFGGFLPEIILGDGEILGKLLGNF